MFRYGRANSGVCNSLFLEKSWFFVEMSDALSERAQLGSLLKLDQYLLLSGSRIK